MSDEASARLLYDELNNDQREETDNLHNNAAKLVNASAYIQGKMLGQCFGRAINPREEMVETDDSC